MMQDQDEMEGSDAMMVSYVDSFKVTQNTLWALMAGSTALMASLESACF